MTNRLVGDAWSTSPQKRAFDIGVATTLLPVSLFLGSIGSAAFFLENGCSPLFPQERVGKSGRRFTAWKFRTMPYNKGAYNGDHADRSGGDGDDRATRVGSIMRKAKVDDSLMLVNVLAGQMSVVGPRPLIVPEVEATYDLLSPSERKDWDHSREILPGEVSDFHAKSRGMDPKSDAFLLARVKSDIWFREHTSPEVDVSILMDAMKAVVTQS